MSLRLPSAKFVVRSAALLLFFVLSSAPATAEQVKDLKPEGYVSDFARVLSALAKDKLTTLCAEVDQKTQAQIAVVTISSLGGELIEQFSIELATRWGVGPKQSARGILILLAPNDHKYRIEVGYGLEPILPDGKVGGFGREALPLLRQNDYDEALLLMARRVASVVAEDKGVALNSLSGLPPPPSGSDRIGQRLWINWIPILIFFLVFGFPALGFILRLLFFGGLGRPYRRRGGWGFGGPWYGGSWSGGSWSGGGGGGGGFGGFGGGSFGGGGASGSW